MEFVLNGQIEEERRSISGVQDAGLVTSEMIANRPG